MSYGPIGRELLDVLDGRCKSNRLEWKHGTVRGSPHEQPVPPPQWLLTQTPSNF